MVLKGEADPCTPINRNDAVIAQIESIYITFENAAENTLIRQCAEQYCDCGCPGLSCLGLIVTLAVSS